MSAGTMDIPPRLIHSMGMKLSWKSSLTLLSISQSFSQSVSIFILTISAVIGAVLSGHNNFATVPIAAVFSGTLIGIFPLARVMALKGRRFGFRIAIVLGITGSVISIFGLYAGSFWIFSFGHVFIGMQQGGFQFLRFAASEIVPVKHQSKGISLVLAGGIIAAFLGPWIAHLSRTYGMTDTLLIAYVPLLVLYSLLFIVFLIIPYMECHASESDLTDRTLIARPLKVIISTPEFLQALLGSAIGFSLMILLMTATPLAMGQYGFKSSDISLVIQWHVLGMYIPSFFTGSLIISLGHRKVIFLGVLAILLEILIVIISQSLISFVVSLTLLGIGWNFIFITSTSRLTLCYKSVEREKVQATHDILVFSLSTVATFLAGPLLNGLGWVNIHVFALVVLISASLFILYKFDRKQ